MVTVSHRPRNRVVFGEIDGDDVAAPHSDAISWIQREAAVSDPQCHGHRLTDELVSVLIRPHWPPYLQVDGLGAAATRRVDVPGDDVTVLDDSLRWIDDDDCPLDAVLVLAPLSLVSDVVHSLRIYIVRIHVNVKVWTFTTAICLHELGTRPARPAALYNNRFGTGGRF